MAENENGNGAAPQIPQMKILGQFIRDISFENILAQKPIAGQMNPDIQVQGLLRTMYDPRNNLSIDVSSELVEHFGDRVYRTVIPRNVALAEAPSFGQSILEYNKNSRGSMAYLALAGEILRRAAKKDHYVNQ